MDVDEWMRLFAMKSLSGDADTYSQGYPHNLIVYFHPDNAKALAFIWDADFSWTRPVSAALYGSANSRLLLERP